MIQHNPTEASKADQGCGTRLKQARLAAGLTQEAVASRLKTPTRVVEALETGHWEVLGAPVFVRGQLRSYARLLKLDLDVDACLEEADLPPVTPPELASHSHTPRYRHVLEQATRNAVYIVMTAAIALPVWWATREHLTPSSSPTVESLEVPGGLTPEQAQDTDPATPASRRPARRTQVVASMTPRTVEQRSAGQGAVPALSLEFNDESWVEIFDAEGDLLEKGLIAKGERRNYQPGDVSRMTVGNMSAVELRRDGEIVDLSSFSKSNVARFTLSSDGSVVPPTE